MAGDYVARRSRMVEEQIAARGIHQTDLVVWVEPKPPPDNRTKVPLSNGFGRQLPAKIDANNQRASPVLGTLDGLHDPRLLHFRRVVQISDVARLIVKRQRRRNSALAIRQRTVSVRSVTWSVT